MFILNHNKHFLTFPIRVNQATFTICTEVQDPYIYFKCHITDIKKAWNIETEILWLTCILHRLSINVKEQGREDTKIAGKG